MRTLLGFLAPCCRWDGRLHVFLGEYSWNFNGICIYIYNYICIYIYISGKIVECWFIPSGNQTPIFHGHVYKWDMDKRMGNVARRHA